MTPEQFQQVRALFEAALEQLPEQRTTWLETACAGDAALHAEVARLLAAESHTAEVLAAALPVLPHAPRAAPLPPLPAAAGQRIGAYELVRELGRGGMGTVWLAERQIGPRVRQQVALKVVRVGASDPSLRRRFEQEREILAALDHPHIARLIDVGASEDGLPYLVMDFVAGEPIDAHCDRHRLPLAARLHLFRTVCAAVGHAHSHGVVHRDLKPSNILVTTDGTVKLLDFGIAKLIKQEGPAETLTRTGQEPLTVAYASPEQVSGGEATVASDVYALGLVLYELLTGHQPYRLRSRMLHEVVRAICEEPPVRPSEMVMEVEETTTAEGRTVLITPQQVGALRVERPERLRRQLSGDLDSILGRALRKEPTWRYTSPEQLSEDLQRHLDGYPVLAHQDSWRYRAGKLAQRALHPRGGKLHNNPLLFLGWGLFAAVTLGEKQLITMNMSLQLLANGGLGTHLLIWSVAWSAGEAWRVTGTDSSTAMDQQAALVFAVTLGALGLLSATAALGETVPASALALFWNAGLGIALVLVGLQAERVLLFGGVALLASVLLGGIVGTWLYAILAIGAVLGLVVPGIIFAVRNPPSLAGDLRTDRYTTLDL